MRESFHVSHSVSPTRTCCVSTKFVAWTVSNRAGITSPSTTVVLVGPPTDPNTLPSAGGALVGGKQRNVEEKCVVESGRQVSRNEYMESGQRVTSCVVCCRGFSATNIELHQRHFTATCESWPPLHTGSLYQNPTLLLRSVTFLTMARPLARSPPVSWSPATPPPRRKQLQSLYQCDTDTVPLRWVEYPMCRPEFARAPARLGRVFNDRSRTHENATKQLSTPGIRRLNLSQPECEAKHGPGPAIRMVTSDICPFLGRCGGRYRFFALVIQWSSKAIC